MKTARWRPVLSRLALLSLLPGIMLANSLWAQDTATLNFEDADISTVISTVSDITGKNFIIDPRVKGKVTVLSPEPLSPEGIYQAFLSILEVHGFAAIASGDVIKVVPETDAKQEGGATGRFRARDDVVTKVIEIENVPAAQLVPILRPLVPQYGHLAAYAPSNMLIISDRAANVARMEQIVRRIDQTTDSEIDIVPLKYASATEVAQIIGTLNRQNQRADNQGGSTVVADERSNSVLISGEKAERVSLRGLITHLDTPISGEGSTQVVYLKFANAETLAPILEGYAEQQQQQGGNPASGARNNQNNNEVHIVAEPDTNALVLTAPPKTMMALRSVINQLDIRRAQVLVEAIIAEVSVNKARELGVDAAIFDPSSIVTASILDPDTLSGLSSATAASAASGTSTGAAAAAALIQQGLNLGVGGTVGNGNFGVILRALAGDGNTNILSTPTLVTLDNEEAEISVGQEVPFLTGSFTNTGTANSAVNPFQTIERRDVGLTLTMTPQINEGNTVQLTIGQETSSISAGSGGAVDLITNKRTLNTSVIVDDGAILVLGGLIDDNIVESEQKVPVLGDIPLLGALFRSRSVTKNKRNLMIFIRPTILRHGGQADYYTRRKYNSIRGEQLNARESAIPLLDGEQRPLLPESQPRTVPPAHLQPAPLKPAPRPQTSSEPVIIEPREFPGTLYPDSDQQPTYPYPEPQSAIPQHSGLLMASSGQIMTDAIVDEPLLIAANEDERTQHRQRPGQGIKRKSTVQALPEIESGGNPPTGRPGHGMRKPGHDDPGASIVSRTPARAAQPNQPAAAAKPPAAPNTRPAAIGTETTPNTATETDTAAPPAQKSDTRDASNQVPYTRAKRRPGSGTRR